MAKSYPHELIGQVIKIIDSKNKDNLGIQGKVVDETKQTLKVLHQGKVKTLVKKNITFKMKGKIFKGEEISKRPEERIK